jgi:transcriptional regulator with XRE-family HTH domain
MLDAAGIRCDGEHPTFESDQKRVLKPRTAEYIREWQDGAVKVLEPHVMTLPEGFHYRFLFLTRSRRQQALSQLKFMRLIGVLTGHVDDYQIAEYERRLREDEAKSLQAITGHIGSVLKIRFEDLIARTESAVDRIVWFLQLTPEQKEQMIAKVRPRSVSVYPGMLELELIQEREAAREKGGAES